jgi:intracellular sulfur oxidation DsrE/DsrF family protein
MRAVSAVHAKLNSDEAKTADVCANGVIYYICNTHLAAG